MANKKNTNPGGGKDDNEMRIQFGLILALCQNCAILHNPLFHAQNSNLFKGLSPMFPPSTTPTLTTPHYNYNFNLSCKPRDKTVKLSVFMGSAPEISSSESKKSD